MNDIVGSIELIIYLLFGLYSIFCFVQYNRAKKKASNEHDIISNSSSNVHVAFTRVVFIVSVPCIVWPLMFEGEDGYIDSFNVYFCLVVFLLLFLIGFIGLITRKEDYYIENDGIHFVRSKRRDIYFEQITDARWIDNAWREDIDSMTRLHVKHRYVTLYNLKETQYRQYISNEHIMYVSKNTDDAMRKTVKAFKVCLKIMCVLCVISFGVFRIYTSYYHSGGALTDSAKYSYEELLKNQDIPHYLIDHGEKTKVSFPVWKTALMIEKVMEKLYGSTFLLVVIGLFLNFIIDTFVKWKFYLKPC